MSVFSELLFIITLQAQYFRISTLKTEEPYKIPCKIMRNCSNYKHIRRVTHTAHT